jgi:hypothetical protein
MIIQVWHSRDSDFLTELYEPIKQAPFFSEHTFIFPHDDSVVDSRESLKNIDLFVAEVSYPATGLGIEIGLARAYGKQILCISKKWVKVSSSLKYMTDDFLEYMDSNHLIKQIWNYLKNL